MAHLVRRALRVDHIGSTAVPGLQAKDVIDIQVTVSVLAAGIEQALIETGFLRLHEINTDHIPSGWDRSPDAWQKWFFQGAASSQGGEHTRPR